MKTDFEKLKSICQGDESSPHTWFSVYHKWDMSGGMTDFTAGFSIDKVPADLSPEFLSGKLPSCDVYKVVHHGSYRHLGNAWASGMMHGRAKTFKQSKAVHPFEIYHNHLNDVPEEELVTSVNFPVV